LQRRWVSRRHRQVHEHARASRFHSAPPPLDRFKWVLHHFIMFLFSQHALLVLFLLLFLIIIIIIIINAIIINEHHSLNHNILFHSKLWVYFCSP